MADQRPPSKPVTKTHARRGDEQSFSVGTLGRVMLAWTAIFPPVWSHAKVMFAIVAPIAATALLVSALVELTAPRSSNPVTLALLASGSAVVLLAWIKAVAIPLVTKGKLPDGRYLADILARQRMRRSAHAIVGKHFVTNAINRPTQGRTRTDVNTRTARAKMISQPDLPRRLGMAKRGE